MKTYRELTEARKFLKLHKINIKDRAKIIIAQQDARNARGAHR